MRALGRVCLVTILTMILLSPAESSQGTAQTRVRSAEPHSRHTPAAEPAGKRASDGGEAAFLPQPKKLESVLGREVRTRFEADAGRIIDLLFDRNGHLQAAVIEFGGFLGIGTRKIAVEWSAVHFEMDGKQPVVLVDVTRDQLRVAPEYKPNEPTVVRRVSD